MTVSVNLAVITCITLFVTIVLLILFASLHSLRIVSTSPVRALFLPSLLAIFLSIFLIYTPLLVDDFLNHARLPVSPEHLSNALKNTHRFKVADLHADALLWNARDLLKTTMHPFFRTRPIGSVDLPRLIAGKIHLQVFAAVNELPSHFSYAENHRVSSYKDPLVVKTILERWPRRTWFSPKERVLYQFQRLHQMENKSNGLLRTVRNAADLGGINDTTPIVRALMAVEGLSCLQNQIESVQQFFDVGIRILGPAHLIDNSVSGSLSGTCLCGLSEFGRQAIQKMKSLNMIVDLTHSSIPTVDDILNLTEENRPAFMISHTGLQAVCPSPRNLNDEYLKRIVNAGGLVGITLFKPALCGEDIITSFVETVSHAAKVLGGVESIAIGSDWDGAITTSVSASTTHLLSSALLIFGNFSHAEVQSIMYDNAHRFFERSLPQ